MTTRRLALNLTGLEKLDGGQFSGILEAARLADELGVDAVGLPDHLALSEQAHRERDGFPWPIELSWWEPMTALAAVAAATTNVRLSTNVLIAPLRPALLLAKQLATLDAISGGRVEVALGVGWQVEEFAAAQMPFEGRFGILEEQIEVCRALWAGGPASHHGKRIQFDDLHAYPLPVQGAGMPIALGVAASPRNVERIVRLGVGWAPAPSSIEDFRAGLAALHAECDRVGRDRRSLVVTAAVDLPSARPEATAEVPHPGPEAEALWEAGADVVLVHGLAFCEQLDELHSFLASMIEVRDR